MTRTAPADLRLAGPAAGAWLGALAGPRLPIRAVVVATAVALAAGALLAARTRGTRGSATRQLGGPVVAAVLLCTVVSALGAGARAEARSTGLLARLAAERAAVRVEAVLTDDPRRAASSTADRVLVVARVRVLEVDSGASRAAMRQPLLVLSGDSGWLRLLPGQRVAVEGLLRPVPRSDDVAAALSARGPPQPIGSPPWFQTAAGGARNGLRAAVSPLPAAEQGLLPGLVVGDTSNLDPQLREDFRRTGLSHLTAVSGTNVAIVVGAVLLLVRLCGAPLRARPALAALALLGFVVLARPSPSVLRAAAMGAVGLLALQLGASRSALPALSASVLVLVLAAPGLAAQPGFALSVLATAGLLVLAPGWRDALAQRVPSWLATALVVPAAAQVACWPVVIAISGQVGLLAVPANLLAIPAVAPATVLGVVAAVLSVIWMPAAQAVAWLAWPAVAWLVLVARTGAQLPGSGVTVPDGAGAGVATALAVAGAWVLLAGRRRRAVLLAVAAGVAGAGVVGLARPAWPPPGWVLVACDVGQGDTTVVRAGRDAAVVVDAGPDARSSGRCLRDLGVRQVPLLLLTHLHADHVDGIAGVLRHRVRSVVVGPLDEPADGRRQVREAVSAAGAGLEAAAVGEVRRVGDVRWTVLAPVVAYRGTRSDPNNSSVVVRVEVGGLVALLTGDVEPEAQQDLLEQLGPDALRADVLKVPHHGSRHQSHEFLRAVRARVATVSSGAGNDYGHPAAATVDALRDAGALVLRTDLQGDLAVVVRDGAVRAVGRRDSGARGAALSRGDDGRPGERAGRQVVTTAGSRLRRRGSAVRGGEVEGAGQPREPDEEGQGEERRRRERGPHAVRLAQGTCGCRPDG